MSDAEPDIKISYPDGYHDPEWDGTEAQFRDIVIPARIQAITGKLNADLDLPDGLRFEWVAGG